MSDAVLGAPAAQRRVSIDRSAAPVGVFDSGLGGLTVAHAIMRQLPSESLIYFGDTARVPYGPKSPDTVRRYSREISAFLIEQGVKAIVVACNTATAHALPALRDELDVPVIGVVEPGARAAVRATRTGHIGVIGTAGTIRSQAYVRAIHAEAPDARVTALACPLFVPLVEEGWTNHEATHLIAEEYLAPFVRDRIDTLVLGCTHYPLLKPLIGEIIGRSVRLIDSAEETAADTRRMLATNDLSAADGEGEYRFIASDDPQQFLTLGRRFLGSAIERVEVRTFG
ncbi:MAG TPA: glutamate racemase [Gemmatimonadaceae bacterium]|nr:glutamate racemase [Gemmatimonadaceae bacterium]